MKKQQKNKIWSIVSTVIYVVLLALLLLTLFMNLTKKENEISSFLGYSFAVVQSGSMIDGGFEIGDMVIIKQVNTDSLRKDDIIVFYNYSDHSYQPNKNDLVKITDIIDSPSYVEEDKDTTALNLHTKQDAINSSGVKLIFHRIIDIYVDEYGMRFYETKGDSNGSADGLLVREDFICAKYLQSGNGIQSVLNFITSPVGIAVVIILPILLTVILEVFVFGKEIKSNLIVEKLMTRKIRYGDVDTQKYKIADFLADEEKIYLYDISHIEDRENLAIILWDTDVQEILNLRKISREKYYSEFEKTLSKQSLKKLQYLKIKADIITKNPNIDDEKASKEAKTIFDAQKEK